MSANNVPAAENAPPSSVTDAVLVASEPVPEGTHKVSGVDFDLYKDRDITVAELVDNMRYTGFQGSAVADAARIINNMVRPPLPSSKSKKVYSLTAPGCERKLTVIPKPVPKRPSSSGTLPT